MDVLARFEGLLWRDFCSVLVVVLPFRFLEYFEKGKAGLEREIDSGDLYRR